MNFHFYVRLHVDVETYLVSPWFETLASACAFVSSKRKSGVSILGYEFGFALKSGKQIHLTHYPFLFDPCSSLTPYYKYRSISSFRHRLSQYTRYCFLHFNN